MVGSAVANYYCGVACVSRQAGPEEERKWPWRMELEQPTTESLRPPHASLRKHVTGGLTRTAKHIPLGTRKQAKKLQLKLG